MVNIDDKLDNEEKKKWEDWAQINHETGLAMDYGNEFFRLRLVYLFGGGVQGLKDSIKKLPFKMEKYEEVYKGKYVITDKNKDSVKKLNELTDCMNNIIGNIECSFDEKAFRQTYNGLVHLIYGNISGGYL